MLGLEHLSQIGCSTEYNRCQDDWFVTECALLGDWYLSMVLWLGGFVDVLCFIIC
ncbi:unnamed protein product, partial [Linum tenue]